MSNKKRYNKKNKKIKNIQNPPSFAKDDEKSFDKINLTKFRNLIANDVVVNTNILNDNTFGDLDVSTIIQAIKNPFSETTSKVLIKASEILMHVSPHYYMLNMAYSNIACFNWGLDLYGVKDGFNVNKLKSHYINLSNKLETMCLKHEFNKIMKSLIYKDVYLGLVIENKNQFFFKELDYSICRIKYLENGLYNFQINLSMITPSTINAYPDYVKNAYKEYLENTKLSRVSDCVWYTPPSDKQICIKFNSQWIYPFPLFLPLFRDIFDLDTYKKLKLQSARTDNYKAIMIKVPIDNNTVDKMLVSPELLSFFAELNRESMNDDIGILHTPGASGEPISFKESSNTRNNVADSTDDVYNSSGTSKELFNGSSSGTAVKLSVEKSSSFIYGVYRQIERWVNRYIEIGKYNKSNYKFKFYLLDMTVYNKIDVINRYKDACTLGATVVDKWLASLDMTPSKLLGSYIVHKDIFDFNNNFSPLSSTYNSTNDKGGRPSNEDTGKSISDEGEKTIDGGKNET